MNEIQKLCRACGKMLSFPYIKQIDYTEILRFAGFLDEPSVGICFVASKVCQRIGCVCVKSGFHFKGLPYIS